MDVQIGAKIKAEICGEIKIGVVTELSVSPNNCVFTYRKIQDGEYNIGWALPISSKTPLIPSWVTFDESTICGSWLIEFKDILQIWN